VPYTYWYCFYIFPRITCNRNITGELLWRSVRAHPLPPSSVLRSEEPAQPWTTGRYGNATTLRLPGRYAPVFGGKGPPPPPNFWREAIGARGCQMGMGEGGGLPVLCTSNLSEDVGIIIGRSSILPLWIYFYTHALVLYCSYSIVTTLNTRMLPSSWTNYYVLRNTPEYFHIRVSWYSIRELQIAFYVPSLELQEILQSGQWTCVIRSFSFYLLYIVQLSVSCR
jgi:hypothetical protein